MLDLKQGQERLDRLSQSQRIDDRQLQLRWGQGREQAQQQAEYPLRVARVASGKRQGAGEWKGDGVWRRTAEILEAQLPGAEN
ncbi:hypothetical protein D3C85_1427200 [compost metagenome]